MRAASRDNAVRPVSLTQTSKYGKNPQISNELLYGYLKRYISLAGTTQKANEAQHGTSANIPGVTVIRRYYLYSASTSLRRERGTLIIFIGVHTVTLPFQAK
jgi:hypothetical protein